MAFDAALGDRIRRILLRRQGITERKMFGGLAFMARGNMFVGILGTTLMARVGPERYDAVLKKPHVRRMDFTGKPLRGYVYVDRGGIDTERKLRVWVERCLDHARSLPSKEPGKARPALKR